MSRRSRTRRGRVPWKHIWRYSGCLSLPSIQLVYVFYFSTLLPTLNIRDMQLRAGHLLVGMVPGGTVRYGWDARRLALALRGDKSEAAW